MKTYILTPEGNPVIENDRRKWSQWKSQANQQVARYQHLDCIVSTIFLGITIDNSKTPRLWETMVFGGELDGECELCSGCKQDALEMHARMVAKIKEHQST